MKLDLNHVLYSDSFIKVLLHFHSFHRCYSIFTHFIFVMNLFIYFEYYLLVEFIINFCSWPGCQLNYLKRDIPSPAPPNLVKPSSIIKRRGGRGEERDGGGGRRSGEGRGTLKFY